MSPLSFLSTQIELQGILYGVSVLLQIIVQTTFLSRYDFSVLFVTSVGRLLLALCCQAMPLALRCAMHIKGALTMLCTKTNGFFFSLFCFLCFATHCSFC
jgi:hypothetical protein